jgi:hypothetical protein
MASSKLLSRHPLLEADRFNMCQIIGKLNFLSASTRPNLAYVTHQTAHFVSKPRIKHTKAVERLTRYLIGTRDKGYIFCPDDAKSVKICIQLIQDTGS